jgi:hypothetical protein
VSNQRAVFDEQRLDGNGIFDNQFFPDPATGGGGSSGGRYRKRARWPLGNLDLETWQRKHARLKGRIEAVQQQIQAKRERSELASVERKLKLMAEIQRLNEKLLALLGQVDEIVKAIDEAEMMEAAAAYIAYRHTH